jgi:hypothetical protein
MEPTSPKARDLNDRAWYALHNGVPDNLGTGGEFHLTGRGRLVNDPDLRAAASKAASFQPHARYLLFELEIDEARCKGYGDVTLPDSPRWKSTGD